MSERTTVLLAGQTAVITGAAQGIGLTIAETFVAHGARVVIGDLDEVRVKAAVEHLGGAGVAAGAVCDVRSAADLAALLDLATGEEPPHVMVNNAGITRDATMRRMTEEQFDEVIDINLKGTWLGMKAAAERMREAGRGSIVNLSSLSGKVGMAGQTNYSAAKAGVVGMTKAAAKELAHTGVRVNAVQPGLIRTPMTEAMPRKAWDQKMSEIPMGRPGEPVEVATGVLFLASALSSYMTGTVQEITGGRFM
ncbi:3-oxoacyl-ACP reductase FabG [Amycolatopsis rhabdoformis]|uniref:3-oxoacyl-ACP reductase FabG n=1 Tax=Amycolatopsis rhabdoformis TaxID=1448059 RepID=A0ABZ1IF62_9PSEU|nr:3-oxoacyl-ACP reductase FabG [Amycolatopsis rhabdoformis]WSE32567.1 3-oxoacyl-ACP reductase FabG [Amycolatopsis rhabdoformis]